ncbi:head GIN domain-containing protein [Pedobacter sp. KR3-3]|uniref:Head GIN domain-containing protein n=1 Tax=Pedobacter albus TaxID=3113905 RepID=A0ABU7I8R1_9SPHI|nr:head GIN domain-containing protein [Pedobacter sp. KR3-3]MEE1945869.1 head GIN domain-containing protein [Pedobacter sp. KR3-3]
MKKLFVSLSFMAVVACLSLQPVLAHIYPIVIGYKAKKQGEVKDYNGVAAGGPIDVIIQLGDSEGVRFEGDADAIAALIVEVKNNVLTIRPENSWNNWSRKYDNRKVTAYVRAKNLKSLTMSGSGKMSVNGTIKGASLSSVLSGSGSISASAQVNKFSGVISGSGSLNFTGSADDASIVVSGSGSFSRKGFSVGSLSTTISGSGNVSVNAEKEINAVISGSGSVNYSGDPSVQKRVSGSGRVRKI